MLAAATSVATVGLTAVLLTQPARAATVNGGFETGTLSGWTSTGSTAVVNSGVHSGTYAARVGGTAPTNGDSTVAQTFTAAAGEAQLSFWYSITCPDTLTYDWATATLKDNTAGTTATALAKTCTNGQGWKQATAAVTAGHSYTLTLISHDDNYAGDATYTLYDDVTLAGGPPPPPGLTQVSTDPFTNSSSQHATEVEPDTFAYGSTIVTSSQVGRFNDGGGSDIGWNTSTDSGATWSHGMLPGITVYQGGGTWARVSDPSVAYDVKHGTWMVSGLVIDSAVNGAGVTVSRSADGVSWNNPVLAIGGDGQGYDKEWIVCDNTSTSPFYGNCYIEVDLTSSGNRVIMSTSTDGGATWSAPKSPSGTPSGLGGQPLVQPSGTVVVPYSTNGSSVRAFSSTNGGSSWGSTSLVANVSSHTAAGGLRDGSGLPSAEIDAAGKIYVAWQDCRFRSGCPSNDIVYSTSTNGTTWSAVTRVPIDATNSGVDHFIPGIGVDHATSGTTAKIGLYYYFYPNANCTASSCQLDVGYLSSANGGSTWSAATTVAGPTSLSQIANTTQGSMVGDYMSTSVIGGKAFAVFAVGKAPANGQAFDEALYTAGGLTVTGGIAKAEHGTPVFTEPATPRVPLTTLR
ncbi:exo-alpha-sialidase [Streptomyces sp. H10-C2]|uniref:exo-alpha-sialidase n=1 Tax=unclassified Streptomyces TaxID=2593676 RepID=UPI0024BB9521|nr:MULTISPECIES: exo-alpha-sialidase [unclassified Streptomyces]MDJ0343944.1 exo-alpha-sialidase [Streptomyces sp. PH10-H1]MDJ0373385.1 exo-alpha-sialidase [Streptomyces sp. H10-C2]